MLRRFFVNTGWLLGDKVIRLVLGLFISAWIARYLGPDQYGKLAYAIAFLAIFQTFSTLSLDSIVVRDISINLTRANEVLGTALGLRLLASIIGFIVAGLLGYVLFMEKKEMLGLIIILGFGIIFQSADVVDLWFQSQSQSQRTVVAKAISYFISIAIKIILILSGAPLWLFAIGVTVEYIFSAVALGISYKHCQTLRRWCWSYSEAKSMLRQSYPLVIAGISVIFYMKFSQLIIGRLMSVTSVGIYATAQQLSELWYFLPIIIVTSVGPIIAMKKAESQEAYKMMLENIFALMWIISVSVAVIISSFSGSIVSILLGEAYEAAAAALSVHIFTLIPVSLGVTQSLWLINENRTHLALYQALTGVVASIGLNIMLIPYFGIVGGAIATLLSQLIQSFLVCALLAPDLFKIQIKSLGNISKSYGVINGWLMSRRSD